MYNEPTKTNEAMKKTMKKFLSMAALALVGAVMTGCSSDDSLTGKAQEPAVKNHVVTLTTTVSLGGDGTRALTIDGNKGVKTFGEGDQIAVIYKNSNNETVKAESVALTHGNITNEGKNATFTVTLENPQASGDVRYIYPAAMAAETVETSTSVTDDATINYAALASQDGTLTTLASKYDLAVFDGSLTADATLPASPTLENKLAIVAYTIKDNAATPNDLTNTITRLTVSDGPNTYGVIRTAAGGPVYIAIRPTSSATISIMATNGTKTYTKSLASKTYAANNIYKTGLKMTEVPDAIPGMFSTSSSGGKVYFSKGNLQYNKNTQTWSFMEHQYSTVEYINQNVGDNYANQKVVSLFGWGTKTNPTKTSTSNTGYSWAEWGENTTLISALGSGWRTLSRFEWNHLFTGRANANTLRTLATVNEIAGLIIMPDGWTASGVSLTVTIANYTTNNINSTRWSTLESQGCVFLPAAGYRNGTSVGHGNASAGSDGLYGCYWSSTVYNANSAYCVDFRSGYVNPASYLYRYLGHSVRLVRPVE